MAWASGTERARRGIFEVWRLMTRRLTAPRLLMVDWAPFPPEGHKLLFVFDGGALDSETIKRIRFAVNELSAYEFHRFIPV